MGRTGKTVRQYRKRFIELVDAAAHRPELIRVISGTYYCHGLTDPITKKKMTKSELVSMFKGNQTDNLAQACNGNEQCKYVVDSKAIGQPSPGCSVWAYHAEYQCITAKKR